MNDQLAVRLRSTMIDGLRTDGALRSERWIQAFLAVPRHEFLRDFFVLSEDGAKYLPVAPADDDEKLRMIYADEAWVTQLDAGANDADAPGDPTSSSSAPSLMARMLEALDVSDDSEVLELGTGTGYNTGLLCAGLSDRQVVSVDIDARLVEDARQVLSGMGYRPRLYVSAGETPAPGLGRFDRIIATYGVTRVPFRWVSLAAVGGVIVASLYREQPVGAMVRLAVTEPGRACGRFLPFYGGFMPTRRQRPTVNVSSVMLAAKRSDATPRVSDLPVLALGLAVEPWQFYAAVALGDIRHVNVLPDDDQPHEHLLIAPDGSWACQQVGPDGDPAIREGGPRRLWTELETAYSQWEEWGKPDRDRFGLTITTGGQHLWLDHPDNTITSR